MMELQSIITRLDEGGSVRRDALWELEALNSVTEYDEETYLNSGYE